MVKEKIEVRDALVNLTTVTPQVRLDSQERDALEDNVSNEEIKSSRLGLRDFFDHFMMLKGANSSFITLIPKVANRIHIKDFRPISFISMHYKIIAKILANRLAKVVDKVVSPEQSAFISGRQILDEPLMLSDVIMDIQEKDKNRSQIDKTEHENGKSVKRSKKSKPSQKVKVNKVKSKSTPGSGIGKSIENQTRKSKLPKVGPPVPT
ncbi:RNA-directed DNA polymerase, eukaryota, reverse transcriptase zinc-binding domain protein [Tanacetum coccineum]